MGASFVIQPHGRLQEWVAEEKGYFAQEGLEYRFNVVAAEHGRDVVEAAGGDVRKGAFESMSAGRACDVSSACHWAVNQAASQRHGNLWSGAYSVAPGGIYVPARSDVTAPRDLAGTPIAVGYHSGSHFSAVQALEAFLEPEEIELEFGGLPYDRVDALLEGTCSAANLWGAATYLADQQGLRKVADTTLMISFLYDEGTDPGDLRRYFAALQRAQRDIDIDPRPYLHYYLRELPERFHHLIDVRAFGPGERLVFLEYTEESYERTQTWMREHGFFQGATPAPYDTVVRV